VISKGGQLFSATGVEVPSVDGVFLVIIPELSVHPTRLAPAGLSSGVHPVRRWEGAEHTFIGDGITLQLGQKSPVLASQQTIPLPNGLSLTYGQILALAGDFYGLPDSPISDDPQPPSVFLQAFNSLASQDSSVAEAQKILQIMQTEIDAVNQAIKQGQQPSSVYAALGDTLSGEWNVATGGAT
jgi:hypothetical protein